MYQSGFKNADEMREHCKKDKKRFESLHEGKELKTSQCDRCQNHYYQLYQDRDDYNAADGLCSGIRRDKNNKLRIEFGYGSNLDSCLYYFSTDVPYENFIGKEVCDICAQEWIDEGILVYEN